VGYATTNDATINECYKEQFLSIKSVGYATTNDATMNECYNEQFYQ
jgi:hypothetical protein